MARDLNTVSLIGNFVADPSVNYTQGGSSIVKFAIANNNTYLTDGRRVDEVSYVDCVVFGKAGETLAKYCKKGNRIGVQGRLKQERWTTNDGQKRSRLVIKVEDFQFLTPGTGQSAGSDDQTGEIGQDGF